MSYPVGLKGVVVGQGDTYQDALRDVQAAVRFHLNTFSPEAMECEEAVLDAYEEA